MHSEPGKLIFEAFPTLILLVTGEKNRVKILGELVKLELEEISISLLKEKTGEKKGEVSLMLRI